MRLIESFEEFLNEIKAEEATTDASAIETILSGKRDCGFIAITTQKYIDPRTAIEALGVAINRGLRLIPVKGRDEGCAFVVWRRDEKRAKSLADFASRKGGYLNDETPDEARLVGGLLSYSPEDIEEYIKRRYK